MSFALEGDAIRARIAANWSDTDIAWPNGSYSPTAGTSFIRVTIRNGESLHPWLGDQSKRRSVGVILGEIFVPSDRFDDAARELADTFCAIFRDAQHEGITYREPRAREAAATLRAEKATEQGDPWYRWLVEVPYYRDWSPDGADELASYNSLLVTQAAHGFAVGEWLYADPATGIWAKAQADAEATLSYPAVVTEVRSATQFRVTTPGGKANLTAHGLGAAGTKVYLSAATPGPATATAPTTGFVQQVATVWDANHLIVNDYPVKPAA